LLAYSSFLNFAISLREQKRRSGVGRPDHNPRFRPTIVRERRQILNELESELLDKELDGDVVVVHDDGDLLEIHDASQAITRQGRLGRRRKAGAALSPTQPRAPSCRCARSSG